MRSVCAYTGDPHMKPFVGGLFDVQHAGVFSMVKQGKRFEIQNVQRVCRPPQKWSAGMSIKCNRGFAIKLENGKVLETTHRSPRLKLNGKVLPLRKGRTHRIGTTAVVCDRHCPRGYEIRTPAFKIRIGISKYSSIIVAAKSKRILRGLTGMCGGGREHAAKLARGSRAQNKSLYPCKGCVRGQGYFGALCPCGEWRITKKADLLFGFKKLANHKWKHIQASKIKINRKKFGALRAGCMRYISRLPLGRLAMRHNALRKTAERLATFCAFDKMAGMKGGRRRRGKHFNRRHFQRNMCGAVRLEIRRRRPAKLLCRVAWRCGQQPRACRHLLRKRKAKPSPCAQYKAKKRANRDLARALRTQVRFRSGSTVLTGQGRHVLNRVAGSLLRFPWMTVVVEGHSPARGAWGRRLTTGRARTAAHYLKGRGCKNRFRKVGKRSNLIGIKIHASGTLRRPRGCRG